MTRWNRMYKNQVKTSLKDNIKMYLKYSLNSKVASTGSGYVLTAVICENRDESFVSITGEFSVGFKLQTEPSRKIHNAVRVAPVFRRVSY
jgi:hypothetical protein